MVLSGPALRCALDAALVAVRQRKLTAGMPFSTTPYEALACELAAAMAANGHCGRPSIAPSATLCRWTNNRPCRSPKQPPTWTCRPGRRVDSLRNSAAGRSAVPGSSTKRRYANTSKGSHEPTGTSASDREPDRRRAKATPRTHVGFGRARRRRSAIRPQPVRRIRRAATTRTRDDDGEYTEEQRQWARDLFATLGDATTTSWPASRAGAPSAAPHHQHARPHPAQRIRIS